MSHEQSICGECESFRQDAERYRWLRDQAGNDVMKELMGESRPSAWDAIVDEYRGVQMGDGSRIKGETP